MGIQVFFNFLSQVRRLNCRYRGMMQVSLFKLTSAHLEFYTSVAWECGLGRLRVMAVKVVLVQYSPLLVQALYVWACNPST